MAVIGLVISLVFDVERRTTPTPMPLAIDQTGEALAGPRSTASAPGWLVAGALAFAGAAVGAFAISNREALGETGRRQRPGAGAKPEAERRGALAAARATASLARLADAVEDREPVALGRRSRPARRGASPARTRTSRSSSGSGTASTNASSKTRSDVADAPRRPARLRSQRGSSPQRELEERVVGRAAVHRRGRAARTARRCARSPRRSPAGPSSGTKNSTLKKPSSKPSARRARARPARRARPAARPEARLGYSNRSKLIVPGYIDGVGDPDDGGPAARGRSPRP